MKTIVGFSLGFVIFLCIIHYSFPIRVVWTKTEKYVITGIEPPTYLYLDLKRISDNKSFHRVYITKHCNDMCLSIGDTINLTKIRFKQGESEWEEFDRYEIYDKYCNCR